jgi:hypothetical protein
MPIVLYARKLVSAKLGLNHVFRICSKLLEMYLLICNQASITIPTFLHAAGNIAVVPTALFKYIVFSIDIKRRFERR